MTTIILASARNYLPGAIKLIESFRRFHDNPIVIISEDMEYDDIPYEVTIHRPDVEAYKNIKTAGGYPLLVYYILDSFKLDLDRVVWLGPDQLIVGDMSEAMESEHDLCASLEIVDNQYPKMFNDSTLSIRPKAFPGLFNRLISIAEEKLHRLEEMEVLNEWVKRDNIDVHYHPEYIDVLKRVYVKRRDWWDANKDNIRSIHYVGKPKPWIGDESGYEHLGKLWRGEIDHL